MGHRDSAIPPQHVDDETEHLREHTPVRYTYKRDYENKKESFSQTFEFVFDR